MARLIIPTRNRPTSLGRTLRYLEIFYPGTGVIVADGSAADHQVANERLLRELSGVIDVDYRSYRYDLPLFSRLREVVASESDEFFIMGSDDDFPVMETLDRCERLLERDAESQTAMGMTLNLTMMNDELVRARVNPVRPIGASTAEGRARQFAAWPFATTYAVARREALQDRFAAAETLFNVNWGAFDFWLGVREACQSTIRVVPSLAFISTRNHNHTYWRPNDRLGFLQNSHAVLAVRDDFEQLLVGAGTDESTADTLATDLILRRIAMLVGPAITNDPAFADSRWYRAAVVQKQIQQFRDLLEPESDLRRQFQPRLAYIASTLAKNAQSDDNAGEARHYETLEQMTRTQLGATPAADQQKSDDAARRRTLDPESPRAAMNAEVIPSGLFRHETAAALDGYEGLHLLVLGDAAVANHGSAAMQSDWSAAGFEDAALPPHDPVPGASSEGGSVWTHFAPKLQASGYEGDLLVTIQATSNASIMDWMAGGAQHESLRSSIPAIREARRLPTHIVFHQGGLDAASTSEYVGAFQSLHQMLAQEFPDALWLMCRSAPAEDEAGAEIREAQAGIIRMDDQIADGPNTGHLGAGHRFDGTHLNEEGLDCFAMMLLDALIAASRRSISV